jgi:hypothetical protein
MFTQREIFVAAASAAAELPARTNPAQSAGLDCQARLRARPNRSGFRLRATKLLRLHLRARRQITETTIRR